MRWLADMFTRKQATKSKEAADEALDDALECTFPASDPPAMTDPNVRVGQRRIKKSHAASRA